MRRQPRQQSAEEQRLRLDMTRRLVKAMGFEKKFLILETVNLHFRSSKKPIKRKGLYTFLRNTIEEKVTGQQRKIGNNQKLDLMKGKLPV